MFKGNTKDMKVFNIPVYNVDISNNNLQTSNRS